MPTARVTYPAASIVVSALIVLTIPAATLAGRVRTPQSSPIASGWNIDLVDAVEAGPVRSVTVSDPYVYAAFGSLLVVLDVASPGQAVRVGAMILPNACGEMEIMGNHLYCYCSQSGVQVVDVSDPSAPMIVGSFAGVGDRMDIDGNLLYIESFSKLEIYDLSNPAAPAHLGTSAFLIGQEFEARNAYVYSVDFGAGLGVIDATDPATPVVSGSVPIGPGGSDVDVAWPYAFAVSPAPSGGGLYVVDVSNPATPLQVAYYASGPFPADSFEEIALNGSTAYVAGGTAPLSVFDVSAPTAPIRLPSVGVCPGSLDMGIGFAGGLAVLDSELSICVMDCASATSPTPHADYEAIPNVLGLAASPTHLVMPTAGGGLVTVDHSNTQQRASYAGSLDEHSTFAVAIQDDYAYLNNCWTVGGTGLLSVFDISDPDAPSQATLFGLSMCPFGGIALGSNHAYLTTFDKLLSIDISDPLSPQLAGQVTVPFLREKVVADPYLYAVSSLGLLVYDVSNPAAPAPVGAGLSQAALGGLPLQIAVANGYAYVLISGPVGGMRIVDLANPLAPAVVGSIEVVGPNFGNGAITVHDSFVYFSTTDGVLRVAEVSDPTAPLEVGNFAYGPIIHLVDVPPFVWAWGGGPILKFAFDLETDVDAPHAPFVLKQNSPNPFNPSTSIAFQLASPARAVIEIFDVRGTLLRTLIDENMEAGPHRVEWNGRDDRGSAVVSGVYFYRLTANGDSQARKMVVVK